MQTHVQPDTYFNKVLRFAFFTERTCPPLLPKENREATRLMRHILQGTSPSKRQV